MLAFVFSVLADTGASDTGASDTGASDTGTSDTGTSDTGTSDTDIEACESDSSYANYNYVDGECLNTDLECIGCFTWYDHISNPETDERFYTCKNQEEAAYMISGSAAPASIIYYFNISGNLISYRIIPYHSYFPICCNGHEAHTFTYGIIVKCDDPVEILIDIDIDTATPDTAQDKPAACGCTAAPLPFATLLPPLLLLLRRRRSVPLA